MKRVSYLVGAAIAAIMASGATQAGVVVLGTSPGHSCYVNAKADVRTVTAERTCDEALASGLMSPRDVMATHINRGIIRNNRTDYDGAIADLDRAIKLDPSEPEAYLNKGSTLLRMGIRTAEPVALFDRALELRTRRPELAYFGRAIAYEVAGDATSAYRDYRRASLAAPKWEAPREELSRFTVRRRGS